MIAIRRTPAAVPSHRASRLLRLGAVAASLGGMLAEGARRAARVKLPQARELLLREFLKFGVVQTDPNFANYRCDAESDRLGLLDFGATRVYPAERMGQICPLMAAACSGDAAGIEAAAGSAGYLCEGDPPLRRRAVAALFLLVGEPARAGGPYDFGRSGLAARLRDSSYASGFDQGDWHPPPAALTFVHRKLARLFLPCARLGARLDVAALPGPRLDNLAAPSGG